MKVYQRRKSTAKPPVEVVPGEVPGIIQTENMQDGCVTHDKLDSQAVESDVIKAQGIETQNLKDGCVTGYKIALQAVQPQHLAPGAVGRGNIAPGAVDTDSLQDYGVTSIKIAPGAITEDKLGPNVGSALLGVDSVLTINVKDANITGPKIAGNAITATKIAAGAVGNSELAANAVTNDKILDGTIAAAKLAFNPYGITINSQAISYALVLADAGKLIDMSSAGPITLTVPKNSVVAFPIGTIVTIRQAGAGLVTIAPVDGDVTINTPTGLDFISQYSIAGLIKVAANVWTAFGALEA
jgi:hypothetical protein